MLLHKLFIWISPTFDVSNISFTVFDGKTNILNRPQIRDQSEEIQLFSVRRHRTVVSGRKTVVTRGLNYRNRVLRSVQVCDHCLNECSPMLLVAIKNSFNKNQKQNIHHSWKFKTYLIFSVKRFLISNKIQ